MPRNDFRKIKTTATSDNMGLVKRKIGQLTARQVASFWSKVDCWTPFGPKRDCWRWTAAHDVRGYGFFGLWPHHHTIGAHRVMWTLTQGPLPPALYVLHRCDTPACVNPKHLFLGTHMDNMNDRQRKNRTRAPYRRRTSRVEDWGLIEEDWDLDDVGKLIR